MENLKKLFLLDPDIVFLNHGSFGACPREVFAEYQRWQLELERRPVEFLGRRSSELLEVSRRQLALFLGTVSERIVYVSNTTTGVNAVARSLELKDGDEVLTTDHEYGACDNAWEHACRLTGARYVKRTVPLPLESESDWVERFFAGATPATRAIYLSHITSTTALIFPVAEVCRRARRAGILTVIDGAHAPGQIDLNLDELDADVYIGNCHKWLCGPKGSAFLYVRPEHQERFDAAVISWGYSSGTGGHTSFDAYTGSTPFVRRHQWQGTRDISAFLAVPAAISFQKKHGWQEVRRRCHEMAVACRDRVGERSGLAPVAPPEALGQMAAIPLPGCDPEALAVRLHEEFRIEIPVTTHGDRIFVRLSVQGYNDESDLEALERALRIIFGW